MDFTLLKEKQIWGDDALDVIKLYGTKAATTDLALLLGGSLRKNNRTSENNLACAYWSSSPDILNDLVCVGQDGSQHGDRTGNRSTFVRPVLPPSETCKITPQEATVLKSGIRTVKYGEYPQTVADVFIRSRLEKFYKALPSTGKDYIFDSVETHDEVGTFKPISYPEYELDGKKYIRILGRPADNDWRFNTNWPREWWPDLERELSTGEWMHKGHPYWVQVQPIEWLVDKSGFWISKKCLFAGIQFDTKKEYDGDFSKTFLKHYLDNYFSKEIEPIERVTKHSRTTIGKVILEEKQRQLT